MDSHASPRNGAKQDIDKEGRQLKSFEPLISANEMRGLLIEFADRMFFLKESS
jgi:hypothetical protein